MNQTTKYEIILMVVSLVIVVLFAIGVIIPATVNQVCDYCIKNPEENLTGDFSGSCKEIAVKCIDLKDGNA